MNECFYQKEKDRTTVAEVEHLLKTAKVRGYGPPKKEEEENLRLELMHKMSPFIKTTLDPKAIETNEKGGKQSALDFRLDLLAPEAMLRLGKVLKEGVHYGVDNWRLIDTNSHLNHALGHIMEYLQGNENGEDHLGHAFCRLMMAVAVEDEA